jgi:hypothetical protein
MINGRWAFWFEEPFIDALNVLGRRAEQDNQGAKALLFPQLEKAAQRLIGAITEKKNYTWPCRDQLVNHVKSTPHASEGAEIRRLRCLMRILPPVKEIHRERSRW